MVNKIFNIPLDMKRPSSSYNDLEVVEGDSGNILVITLTDDGEVVDLTGCRVLAVFSRADGKTVEQDTDGNGITVGGDAHNEITIDLYQDSFRPGSVSCEIQVYSGTDTLVTSARFTFSCRPSIMNDTTIAATDEYPILVKLINDTEQACADAVEAVETANTAAESATGAATAANTAADAASAAAIDASDAASAAGMQAGRAETAAIAAEGATDRANTAAERAEQAVTNPADMTKSVYDTNNSGVVDNAERLGGKLPDDYAAAKHAAQHAAGGSDAITPGSIGAALLDANGVVPGTQNYSYMLWYSTQNRILQESDVGRTLMPYDNSDHSKNYTITVPAREDVAIIQNAEIAILRYFPGDVTITPAEGVGLRYIGVVNTSRSVRIANQYGMVALKKISDTSWLVTGDFEEVV